MNIKELNKEGFSQREIEKLTGHSRHTIRKVLKSEHRTKQKPHARTSKLDPLKNYTHDRYPQVS